jgi:hypothetical protein
MQQYYYLIRNLLDSFPMVCQVYSFYFEAVGIATVIWIVLINILTQVSFKKTSCTEGPYIFSWPVMISNSVNEFFVAV